MLNKLATQPIKKILLASFILVAIVPVIFLSFRIYQVAWEDSWREIHEKHKLLAQNLASPISIYINDHRNSLGLLASDIRHEINNGGGYAAAQLRLNEALDYVSGFRSLGLVSANGEIMAHAGEGADLLTDVTLYNNEQCFVYTRDNRASRLSAIKPSPLTGEPTLILTQPVMNEDGGLRAVLLAELRIELIEKLRRNIKFGKKGHAAIVDQFGRVIAHPNPEWMKEIRDLSKWPIVQSMITGNTGVTEFYSSFIKENMIAGYTSVPGLGWGIMVPQPKSEVSDQVNAIMTSHLISGIVGLILATIVAIMLARWITGPIERLANASQRLVKNRFKGDIPKPENKMPREVYALDSALQELVSGLQQSHNEVSELNKTLEKRVKDATGRLRRANDQLEKLANLDHLTELPNRRHFEASLSKTLYRRDCDKKSFCIMLIDIDDFKAINDEFGHAAGDAVLRHVANVLEHTLRADDLVARYGGDEFAVQMRCEREAAKQKAWEIRESIRNQAVQWKDCEIQLTTSIGLSCHPYDETMALEEIMHDADGAMYEAKKRGKNTVVDLFD